MSVIPGDNLVCCTLQPVESNYKPKGAFKTAGGIPTYVVGDKASKKAIVVVMDAMGMVQPTQQGCGILASQGFYVLMPDFLGDQALTPGDILFDTPEKIEKRNRVFSGVGNPHRRLPDYLKVGEELKAEGFVVGGLGFCWGGKIAFMAGAHNVYTAIAAVHPAALEAKEAEGLKAIIGLYPSKDEDPAMIEPFEKIARDYKLYSQTHHGFAAARANLEDPIHRAAYEDVYGRLSVFFKTYLTESAN